MILNKPSYITKYYLYFKFDFNSFYPVQSSEATVKLGFKLFSVFSSNYENLKTSRKFCFLVATAG